MLIRCKTCEKEISAAAIACPHCGEPQDKSDGPPKALKIFTLGMLGLLGAVALLGYLFPAPPVPPEARIPENVRRVLDDIPAALRIIDNVRIERVSFRKDSSSIMIADFTFRNDNPFDVKDLEVLCSHSGPSGTIIDNNRRTIYEIVRANSARAVQGFNMGFINSQAIRSQCRIVSAARA